MPAIDLEIIVDKKVPLVRIDLFLHGVIANKREILRSSRMAFSRSRIQSLIREESILVNGKPVKPNYVVRPLDRITLCSPVERRTEPDFAPEEIYFEVIYNDGDLLVLNKPGGLVVHPAAGHYEHTLLNGLAWLFPELREEPGMMRMGMVHRLDMDTSGLLVVTKNDAAQMSLMSQFKNRSIRKEYAAIVTGLVEKSEGEICSRIGRHPSDRKKMAVLEDEGRESLTRYRVVSYLKNATLLALFPHTGRTHQLRVHMSHIRHPIVGDEIYSRHKSKFHGLGLMLCARKICFYHPQLKKDMEFEVGLPDRFRVILNKGEC